MKIEIGEVLYYKGIGLCEVVEKKELDFHGSKQKLVGVKSFRSKMKIMFQEKDHRSIRKLVDKQKAEESLKILNNPAESNKKNKNWNQRFKQMNQIMASGDIQEIAKIYAELNQKKELSFSEKKIKEDCFNLVNEEINFVLK